MDELALCAKDNRFLKTVVGFDGTANHDAPNFDTSERDLSGFRRSVLEISMG